MDISLLSGLIGGAIGSILTAAVNLAVNYQNNKTQKRISADTAAWAAQREKDEAERRSTHEREVWVRERKEKAYNSILDAGEYLKNRLIQKKNLTEEKIEDAVDVINNPPIMVYAPPKVIEAVQQMQEKLWDYLVLIFEEGTRPGSTLSFEDAQRDFYESVKTAVNLMRDDLGFAPIYFDDSESKAAAQK